MAVVSSERQLAEKGGTWTLGTLGSLETAAQTSFGLIRGIFFAVYLPKRRIMSCGCEKYIVTSYNVGPKGSKKYVDEHLEVRAFFMANDCESAADKMIDIAVAELRTLSKNPSADGDLGSSVPLKERKSGRHLLWIHEDGEEEEEEEATPRLAMYHVTRSADGYILPGSYTTRLERVYTVVKLSSNGVKLPGFGNMTVTEADEDFVPSGDIALDDDDEDTEEEEVTTDSDYEDDIDEEEEETEGEKKAEEKEKSA